MDVNPTMKSNTIRDIGKVFKELNLTTEPINLANAGEELSDGWDALEAGDKAQREYILNENFLKALARFNAGVSLTKIRRHYETLGAKYSPVTFRRKWDELVKRHTAQV
jgi:hypothetical protein